MIKKGTNIYIRPLTAEDAEACLDLQNANRPFFEQFSWSGTKSFIQSKDNRRGFKVYMKICRMTKIIILASLILQTIR